MNIEAVVIKNPNGNKEAQLLGVVVRASATPNARIAGAVNTTVNQLSQLSFPSTSSSSNNTPSLPMQVGTYQKGQGGPIRLHNTNQVLMPTSMKLSLTPNGEPFVSTTQLPINIPGWVTGSAIPIRNGKAAIPAITATLVAQSHNQSSPCPSQPRSLSACSTSSRTDSSPLSPGPANIIYVQQQPLRHMGDVRSPVPVLTRVQASTHGWIQQGSSNDSSTTPDSGIQSVPGSPPNNIESTPPTLQMTMCGSATEERDDDGDDDYTDMPCLLPADADDADIDSSPISNSRLVPLDETHMSNGSECETSLIPSTSISITSGMDSNEIVEQLLQLDPEKANHIAKLIRRKTQLKRRSGSRQDVRSKRGRPDSAASEETRRSEEEQREAEKSLEEAESIGNRSQHTSPVPLKRRDSQHADTEKAPMRVEPLKKIPEAHDETSVIDEAGQKAHMTSKNTPVHVKEEESEESLKRQAKESRRAYRRAVANMMQQRVNIVLDKTVQEMKSLHIGHRRIEKKDKKDKSVFNLFMEDIRMKRRKFEEDKKHAEKAHQKKKREETKIEEKIEKKEPEVRKEDLDERLKEQHKTKSLEKKSVKDRYKDRKTASRMSVRTPHQRLLSEGSTSDVPENNKIEADYEEITRSIGNDSLPGWKVSTVHCGCLRGACTSDAECINRALYRQCPPTCAAPLCANKKFWKDDAIKQLSASGPKSKRVLRTRQARRAGEFLGEFAGEVITYSEACSRGLSYLSEEVSSRVLCLSSTLFVDATKKGNICRYVRHSCKPNSRLEVWSVNGHLHAGIFTLVDISSGAEVTINMDCLLPMEQSCNCNAPNCRKILRQSRNAVLVGAPDQSIEEERFTKASDIFLLRNREKTIERAQPNSTKSILNAHPVLMTAAAMSFVLEGLAKRVRRIDGSLPLLAVRGYSKAHKLVRWVHKDRIEVSTDIVDLFYSRIRNWLNDVQDDDCDRAFSALRNRYLMDERCDKADERTKKKKDARFINRETDLSYTQSDVLVGSYDPDAAWPRGKVTKSDDAVRCYCGSLEDDGDMVQCDSCHFWLHIDCLEVAIDPNNTEVEYRCQFCTNAIKKGVPSMDVILKSQPSVKIEGCVYYKSLVNRRSIQVRLNETVYVEASTDEHKKILKRLSDEDHRKDGKNNKAIGQLTPVKPGKLEKKLCQRSDLRIFRVERLFTVPAGHRFVFGFYYARPHETFCDSHREFHRNEVFATPLYDTLLLDTVIGRCMVMDQEVWCKGRPTVPLFKEPDVYLCEFQVDKNQRSFERILPKNRFQINTQPYVFNKFDTPWTIVRDFTPFVTGERTSSRNSRNSNGGANSTEAFAKTCPPQRLHSITDRLTGTKCTASKASKSSKKDKRKRK